MTGAPFRRAVVTMVVGLPGLTLVLVGCGSSGAGTTLAQQVTNWATATGFPAAARGIHGDIANLEKAPPRLPVKALRTYCDVLVTDTLSANQNLPSPDRTLTDLLSTAYTEAATAGRDCFSGAGGDARLLARSSTERTRADRDLIKAQARYDFVTSGLSGTRS
jgi:hypothetical protein